MKIGEKKLTKGSGLKGSGGSGGAYTSKGSFLKALAKKFGFGKRTSPQVKAEAAWEQSLAKGKPSKAQLAKKWQSFDKKDMEKAQAKTAAKIRAAKQKAAESKAKDKEEVDYTKDLVSRIFEKGARKTLVPATLYSAYEMSQRKKKKKK
tara:strand:- start:463 stop:909 length:447 start_codon:yes stop_codon:yes gene_type:complete